VAVVVVAENAQEYAHLKACPTAHLTVPEKTAIDAMYKVKTVVVVAESA